MGQARRAQDTQRRWRQNTNLYFFLSIPGMVRLQRSDQD